MDYSRNDTMLTIREACKLLNVHAHTLRRWNDQGILKAQRVGPRGDRRFSRIDIVALLRDTLDLKKTIVT